MQPMNLRSELFDSEQIGFDWNLSNICIRLSESVLVNDIEFNTAYKILSSFGGTVVVVKGFIYIISRFIIKGQWKNSLINEVRNQSEQNT